MYKCLDQINRAALVEVATRAGMPTRLLAAYMSHLWGLQVAVQMGSHLDAPRMDFASMPQGCPLGMMFVALLMRPWIATMNIVAGIKCFILGDHLRPCWKHGIPTTLPRPLKKLRGAPGSHAPHPVTSSGGERNA